MNKSIARDRRAGTFTLEARVWLFLALTCVATGPFWALSIATGNSSGGRGAYAIGAMWGPGIAALVTCLIVGQPVSSLGWKWGQMRWQFLSYAWPLAICCVTYGLVYATGFGGFPKAETITSLRKSLGWPCAETWVVVSGWFVLFATTGIAEGVTLSLGEEIGWRGFLSPIMFERFGFTRGALLTGAIWAVWHFPVIFFSNYDSATPRWFATPCFLVEVLSLAVIMSWIRMRSGSLWTGAIAHTSINLFNQGFFFPLTSSRGSITAFSIGESGAVLPLVLSVAAVLFWSKRRQLIATEITANSPFGPVAPS